MLPVCGGKRLGDEIVHVAPQTKEQHGLQFAQGLGDNGLDGCGEGEAIEALFGFVFVDRLGHYSVAWLGSNDADGGVGIAEKGVFTEEIPERLEGGASDVDLRFFTEKGSLV